MKKTLLSFTFLAMAGMAAAHAADTVAVYGVLDAGITAESGPVRTTKLGSGLQNESRIGVKGSEDLGNGLKAIFVAEGAFGVDTGAQNGALFGRQSYVGLSSNLGTLTMGRQMTALYDVLHDVGDPFQMGTAGTAGNLFSIGAQSVSNTVRFASEETSGFSGEMSYSFGEVPGNLVANRTSAGAVGYASGALVVRAAYSTTRNVLDTDLMRTTLLAGSYDFGFAKANMAYAANGGSGVDSHDFVIGGSVPFGRSAIKASYTRKNDRTLANNDAVQYAIGYEYSVSKRTHLYSSVAHIVNSNAAAYTVGNASDAGSGDRAVNVGISHQF